MQQHKHRKQQHSRYSSQNSSSGRQGSGGWQRKPGRQTGAAMLMAMLVVVLVAAVAAAAAWRQWTAIEVEQAERDRSQAIWLLDGALDWVRLVLMLGVEKKNYVYHGQGWDVPLKESRLSTFLAVDKDGSTADLKEEDITQAFLSGQVLDLHARLNLHSVVKRSDGKPDQAAIRQTRRLFSSLAVPDGDRQLALLVSGLQQADSAQNSSLTSGQKLSAEDAAKPLRPMYFQQLRWYGLTQQTLDTLEKCRCVSWIDADASDTRVNLNTADSDVLAAVLDITASEAEEIRQERSRQPFPTLADVSSRLPALKQKIDAAKDYVSVDSHFFQVLGALRVNDINIQQTAAVQILDRRGRLSRLTSRENRAVGAFIDTSREDTITEENFSQRFLDATQGEE